MSIAFLLNLRSIFRTKRWQETRSRTRSSFFSEPPCLQEGARHASRRRELSTGVTVTGFLILLLGWKWERADLWQKVGIWRRIELDAPLAASPRQITKRNKKGGEKKERQKGEGKREVGLDKNRRERNKGWEINRGKREEKECILLLARGGNGKESERKMGNPLKRCGEERKNG